MERLTLNQANTIADAGLAKARELKLKPMAIAVFDEAGVLRVLKMEDGGTVLRPDIAIAKAWTGIAMGLPTRAMMGRAATVPTFVNALIEMGHGRIVTVPGGVIIRRPDGSMMGTVGVSGDTSDQDEVCAIHGIVTAGLIADSEG